LLNMVSYLLGLFCGVLVIGTACYFWVIREYIDLEP